MIGVKNRPEKHFLSHERHPNKTKETPINDLKKEFCNVCDTQFTSTTSYCSHINNIQKPKPKRIYKPDPPKTPNAKDLNSYYCGSCSITFNGRAGYSNRLNNINRTPHLISPKLQNLKNMKPKIDILDLCCDVCKKIYPCKRLYIRHLVKFHEITLPNVYLEPTNFDSISRYCKVCDISFRQDSTFAAHLRNMHPTAIHSGPDLIPNMNEKKFTVFRANKRLSVDNLIYIICLLFILTKCLKFIKEQIARTLV